MTPRGRVLTGVAALLLACFDPTATPVEESTSGSTSGRTTGAESSTAPADTSATAPVDSGEATAGCTPGVFGESRFGEACFQ